MDAALKIFFANSGGTASPRYERRLDSGSASGHAKFRGIMTVGTVGDGCRGGRRVRVPMKNAEGAHAESASSTPIGSPKLAKDEERPEPDDCPEGVDKAIWL